MQRCTRVAIMSSVTCLALSLLFGGNPARLVAQISGQLNGDAATPIHAAHVTCNNNSGDAALIQNAINSGTAVILTGSCNLESTTLTIGSNFFLGGSATLTHAGSGFALASSGNYNTVKGLTFNGGGVNLSLKDQTNWTGQYGWTIEDNTFANITNGTSAVYISNVIGKGAASSISHNRFYKIWPGGIQTFLRAMPRIPAGRIACLVMDRADLECGSKWGWIT